MRYSLNSRVALLAAFLASCVLTVPGKAESNAVEVGGYSFWQFGQIVEGNDRIQGPVAHAWLNDVFIGMTFKARPSEYLALVVNPEFKLSYPYPQERNFAPSTRPFGSAYIHEAYGDFLFGEPENPLLQARLGMFVFKYSRDARNLGDYLFRTGTFPTYIINDFDFPAERLLGLCLSSDFIPNLHADLLLTSEFSMFPFGDFSLAGIASYKLLNAIEIGGGIDLARVLPIIDTITSPRFDLNTPPAPNMYVTSQGDTGFYSFQATKVMARTSIDPKQFFGSPEIFGNEDLKLYGEVCWVGIEGYDDVYSSDSLCRPWYHNLDERTPRMVGFNIPAFKLLDVFSAELEYFPSVLPNDYGNVLRALSPMPHFMSGLSSYKKEDWDKGAWRWSIYAKKMVIEGFSVITQAAFDHMRTMSRDVGAMNEYESLIRKGHWHWNVKFSYAF
jgi:hypothetical protein